MQITRLITQAANRASHHEALAFELDLRRRILQRAQIALDSGESEADVLERVESYAQSCARTLSRAGSIEA